MTGASLISRALIALVGTVTAVSVGTEVADEITRTYQPVIDALEQINGANQ